jgi:hypothetical protein
MAYTFTGIIIPDGNIPNQNDPNYIVKNITTPIHASIIYIKKDVPEHAENNILNHFNLTNKQITYLFLKYVTWAGQIDHVKARLSINTSDIITDEADDHAGMTLFLRVMERIGISREQALNFDPFKQGYFETDAVISN